MILMKRFLAIFIFLLAAAPAFAEEGFASKDLIPPGAPYSVNELGSELGMNLVCLDGFVRVKNGSNHELLQIERKAGMAEIETGSLARLFMEERILVYAPLPCVGDRFFMK